MAFKMVCCNMLLHQVLAQVQNQAPQVRAHHSTYVACIHGCHQTVFAAKDKSI
jgi:hypothetical protein